MTVRRIYPGKIILLNVGDMRSEVIRSYDPQVLLWISIYNTGADSIAEQYQLSATLTDGE